VGVGGMVGVGTILGTGGAVAPSTCPGGVAVGVEVRGGVLIAAEEPLVCGVLKSGIGGALVGTGVAVGATVGRGVGVGATVGALVGVGTGAGLVT